MEFNEKLQALRKRRSMTQAELAEALFVSRTAISKWESGRGYPSIDSLKQISRFFSVKIDELICADEIITAAEQEKRAVVDKSVSMACGALDLFPAILLFIPAFGNGAGSTDTVALFAADGLRPWIRIVFAALIALSVLNGLCGVIVARFEKPLWDRHRRVTGLALSIIGTAVFIVTRQPYAGIVCFALLVVKAALMYIPKQ